jgi:hypothetical protein
MRVTILLSIMASTPALAFNFESVASPPCHEELALAAVSAGWPDDRTPPTPSDDDLALRESLPFATPAALDRWTASTLIGVRDPDLMGSSLLDLPELAEVHQSAERQDAHCLRSPSDDGSDGDMRALAACRAFILEEVAHALGVGDEVDLEATTTVPVALRYQAGQVEVQRFGFHLGRALHALQDAYSHTLREDDAGRVQHVLNYVDPAVNDWRPSRDGHAHTSAFDTCDGSNRARFDAARDSSVRLVDALRSDEGGRRGRLMRVEALLDEVLARDPSCVPENDWCGATSSIPAECACGRASARGPWVTMSAVGLILLTLFFGRGRSGSACVAVVMLAAQSAEAAPRAVAVDASVALTVDRGGAAITTGALWRPSDRVELGLRAEINPFFDLVSATAAPGVLNVYGSGSWCWLRTDEGIEVRSTAQLGTSTLLFAPLGTHLGDTGVYLGASLLGVAVPMGERFELRVDPATFAVVVPHLGGVPFAHRQYRFTLGGAWWF